MHYTRDTYHVIRRTRRVHAKTRIPTVSSTFPRLALAQIQEDTQRLWNIQNMYASAKDLQPPARPKEKEGAPLLLNVAGHAQDME